MATTKRMANAEKAEADETEPEDTSETDAEESEKDGEEKAVQTKSGSAATKDTEEIPIGILEKFINWLDSPLEE